MPSVKDDRRRRFKNGTIVFLKGVATALAVARKSDKAADIWLEKIYSETGEGAVRKRTEEEFVGKFVFLTPTSNPIQVVWGYVQEIVWREHQDGDLMIIHPVHKYTTAVNLADKGVVLLFNSESELREYVNDEYDEGNIREGSFKVTLRGAKEYGSLILLSLHEYAEEKQSHPIRIPSDFRETLSEAYSEFARIPLGDKRVVASSFPTSLGELASLTRLYPMEGNILSIVVSYVFLMIRLAALSEEEQAFQEFWH